MAGGLFVLPKMHKITQNSLLKKHGIFCLTFSKGGFFVKNTCIFLLAVVSYYGYKGWSSAVHTPECVDVPLREAA